MSGGTWFRPAASGGVPSAEAPDSETDDVPGRHVLRPQRAARRRAERPEGRPEVWRLAARRGAATTGPRAWLPLARWLGVGVALGLMWRGLTPLAQSQAHDSEQLIAGQVVLAVLGIIAGLVVAVQVLIRSGPGSAARLAGAVAGSTAASVMAWGTGRILGERGVEMTAIPLLWPLTVATVTVLVSLVTTLMSRDSY